MEDKKFKEELSKIAKWYIPVVRDGSSVGTLLKPRSNSSPNDTFGPVIEELNPCLRVCESCDKITDQRVSHSLKFTSIDGKRPKRRWEHTCQTCKKGLDPVTMKVKEKPKSDLAKAKEKADAVKTSASKKHWWNDPVNYTGLDNNKLG